MSFVFELDMFKVYGECKYYADFCCRCSLPNLAVEYNLAIDVDPWAEEDLTYISCDGRTVRADVVLFIFRDCHTPLFLSRLEALRVEGEIEIFPSAPSVRLDTIRVDARPRNSARGAIRTLCELAPHRLIYLALEDCVEDVREAILQGEADRARERLAWVVAVSSSPIAPPTLEPVLSELMEGLEKLEEVRERRPLADLATRAIYDASRPIITLIDQITTAVRASV